MKNINIIYLLPEMKGASGGAKVIYKHSAILNNIDKNVSSSVNHLKKKISYKIKKKCRRYIQEIFWSFCYSILIKTLLFLKILFLYYHHN